MGIRVVLTVLVSLVWTVAPKSEAYVFKRAIANFNDDFNDPFFADNFLDTGSDIYGNQQRYPGIDSVEHNLGIEDFYETADDAFLGSPESIQRALDSTLFFGSIDHDRVVSYFLDRKANHQPFPHSYI